MYRYPLPALLDALDGLPAGGYRARVAMLLRRAGDLFADPRHTPRVLPHLLPFTESSPDAWALHTALTDTPPPGLPAAVRAYAAEACRTDPQLRAGLEGVVDALVHGQRIATFPPTPAPAMRALDAFAAGVSGVPLDGFLPVLAPLPAVLLDELVAAGTLPWTPRDPQPPWLPAVTSYLRCRLTPAAATHADLVAAGFDAELARRHYLAGDEAALAAMDAADPDVAHVQALDVYRRTGRLDADRLRPAARDLLHRVDALRSTPPAAGDGRVTAVPAELAADPSCWPLLGDVVLRDDIAVGDHPAFAAWVELCGLRQRVYDVDWTQAVTAGRALVAHASPALRTEARSLLAYAEQQLGKVDDAIRTLDEALRDGFVLGVAVNAAVVAADRGSVAPLPYLRMIAQAAPDEAMRAAALHRAVDLWTDDPGKEYPPALAELVREALDRPQPDALHRRLLALSAGADGRWLADARIRTTGPGQSDAVLYHRTSARAASDTHPEAAKELAQALITIARRTPRAAWVDRELAWVVESLMDGVHEPFGTAAHLTPMIDPLVGSGLLPLADQLILSVQAGAHTALALEEEGRAIAPDVERRLLLDPVRLFQTRAHDLPEDRRDEVTEEIGACLGVAVSCAWAATNRAMDAFVEEWNGYHERRRWDHDNVPLIAASQRRLLRRFEPSLQRCRAVLATTERLPLTESGTKARELLIESVSAWSGELARLGSQL